MKRNTYDKNSNYDTRRLASDIMEMFPGHYKNLDSACGSVSSYIKRMGFVSVNGQKWGRVFSGTICNKIVDYFIDLLSNKNTTKRQIRVEDVILQKTSESFSEVSVTFKSNNGRKLDGLSKDTNIAKVKILDAVLTAFFEIYPEMSPEELRCFIKSPSFVETHHDNKEQSDDSNGVISRLDTIVELLDQINKYLT